MHNSAQLRCFENGNDDFGVEAFWIGDAARVGYFVPLNGPLNGHPPSTLLWRPRTDKRGGGVGLYVTDKSSFKVRDDLVMNPVTCQYESLFIETVMHDHKVIIGVMERGSSVVERRTLNQVSRVRIPLCYPFGDWVFSFSPLSPLLTQLYK